MCVANLLNFEQLNKCFNNKKPDYLQPGSVYHILCALTIIVNRYIACAIYSKIIFLVVLFSSLLIVT